MQFKVDTISLHEGIYVNRKGFTLIELIIIIALIGIVLSMSIPRLYMDSVKIDSITNELLYDIRYIRLENMKGEYKYDIKFYGPSNPGGQYYYIITRSNGSIHNEGVKTIKIDSKYEFSTYVVNNHFISFNVDGTRTVGLKSITILNKSDANEKRIIEITNTGMTFIRK